MSLHSHHYTAVPEYAPQESVLLNWPGFRYAYRDEKVSYDVQKVAIDVIRELQPVVRVIIQALGYDHDAIRKTLTDAGISLEGITIADFQSDFMDVHFDPKEHAFSVLFTYLRDSGAEVVMDECGNRAAVTLDQAGYSIGHATRLLRSSAIQAEIFRWHAAQCGIDDFVFTRLVSEGGDREFTGNGVMLTTEETEVNKRNPFLTREEVEREYKRIFGLKKILWVPRGSYDDEDQCTDLVPGPDGKPYAYRTCAANCHMDEMARFADDHTIILGEVAKEEAAHSELSRRNKERFDLAYAALKDATDAEGKPFRIVRIPVPEHEYLEMDIKAHPESELAAFWRGMPGMFDGSPLPQEVGRCHWIPGISYTNFLVTNGKVLMQKYYREGISSEKVREKDAQAKAVLESCFPGRRVIPIDAFALNVLGGGIHCLTRNVPAPCAR
ncbi:MAG: agmatine/peptidylarginine deiminase [Lachnospiraceae bacterium]